MTREKCDNAAHTIADMVVELSSDDDARHLPPMSAEHYMIAVDLMSQARRHMLLAGYLASRGD